MFFIEFIIKTNFWFFTKMNGLIDKILLTYDLCALKQITEQ